MSRANKQNSNYKHGHRRPVRSPTYRSWSAMRDRCSKTQKLPHSSKHYAGVVCDPRWGQFALFLEDMGERPEGTSIDRIDNTKPYCKANCKWSNPVDQAINRRQTIQNRDEIRALVAGGLSQQPVADKFGINQVTVSQIVRRSNKMDQVTLESSKESDAGTDCTSTS